MNGADMLCLGIKIGTSKIDVYPLELHPGQTVYLIDTPGFNDTYKSDDQILVDITTWLATSYNNKVHLNGVIYLHDIIQGRMYGSSLRTLQTFRELSGADAMKKVILTTTHWDIVHSGSLTQAEGRENQLVQTEAFWGSMIAKGARVERHDNTKACAERLIRLVVPQSPVTLAVQSQMVDQHLKLSETTAGKTLAMDLIKKMDDSYRQQLAELRANKKQSEDMRRQHEQELANMRQKLEITSREMTDRMNRELEARETQFREQAEAQAQREEEFRREQAEAYARREEALRRDLELERQQLREQGAYEWEDEDNESDDEGYDNNQSYDYGRDESEPDDYNTDSSDSDTNTVQMYNGNGNQGPFNYISASDWGNSANHWSSGLDNSSNSLQINNSGVYINGRHIAGNASYTSSCGNLSITNNGGRSLDVENTGNGSLSINKTGSGSGSWRFENSGNGSLSISVGGSGSGSMRIDNWGDGDLSISLSGSGSGTLNITTAGNGSLSVEQSGSGSFSMNIDRSGNGSSSIDKSGSGSLTIRNRSIGGGRFSINNGGSGSLIVNGRRISSRGWMVL